MRSNTASTSSVSTCRSLYNSPCPSIRLPPCLSFVPAPSTRPLQFRCCVVCLSFDPLCDSYWAIWRGDVNHQLSTCQNWDAMQGSRVWMLKEINMFPSTFMGYLRLSDIIMRSPDAFPSAQHSACRFGRRSLGRRHQSPSGQGWVEPIIPLLEFHPLKKSSTKIGHDFLISPKLTILRVYLGPVKLSRGDLFGRLSHGFGRHGVGKTAASRCEPRLNEEALGSPSSEVGLEEEHVPWFYLKPLFRHPCL